MIEEAAEMEQTLLTLLMTNECLVVGNSLLTFAEGTLELLIRINFVTRFVRKYFYQGNIMLMMPQ
jgi:hypothetical protein